MNDLKSGETANKVINWAQLLKSIVTAPKVFFADTMLLTGGIAPPLTFYAGVAAVNTFFVLLIGLGNPLQAIGTAVFTFAFMMAMSFVSAGITMWLSRAFGGTGDFEATYRAVAYASGPNVIGWLPILGFFAGVYSLFLMRLGLERAHGLTPQRAFYVLAIEIGIFFIVGCIVAMVGMAKVFQATNGI